MPLPRLGELLVADGVVAPAAVHRALGFQKTATPRLRLGSILLTWDLLDEGSLLRALASLHRCEAVTGDMLARAPVEVVRLLPQPHAVRMNAVAYALERSRIRVGFVDPTDIAAIDEVSAITGHSCVPGVVTELRLLQAHRRFYGRPIPVGLRPSMPRMEARASRPDSSGAAAVTPGPRVIPILDRPSERRAAEEPAEIRVPDLPIPPTPDPGVAEAASVSEPAAPQALPSPAQETPPPRENSMWLPSAPEAPLSESARGMWSDSAPAAEAAAADLGDLAIAAVPADFPRAILLAERGGVFETWRARGLGTGVTHGLRAAAGDASPFAAVAASGTPHVGRVDSDRWPAAFAKLLDSSPCVIFPIQSGRGVAALLYADRRGAPMRFEDTALLARAAANIAALLARAPAGPPS